MQTKKLRVLDLFSGIGGFSLGLERTGGFETVAFCEIEPYPQKVLARHWPGVPIYEDVRELTAERLARDGIGVDVITGGFPCQPHSTAAAGKNPEDTLAAELLRLIYMLRPKYIIAENTERKAYPPEFINKIFALGYTLYPKCISAADAGADHERCRWWLCAYTDDKSELPGHIDAKVAELQSVCVGVWGPENYARAVRVPYGLPHRMDRLKALGNAVVPQIPELIGRAILTAEEDRYFESVTDQRKYRQAQVMNAD